MKPVLLLLFIWSGFFSFSQVVHGIVTDNEDNPLAFCEVRDTISKKLINTDQLGAFTLIFSEKVVLKISHSEFEAQLFVLEGEKTDVLIEKFQLNNPFQLIEGVTITSERMETVVDQKAINVIDYLPFDNAILVLKSYKRERILSIEGQDTTYRSYGLGKIKATSIFQDCFENIHLLTEDSAYQIWMDSTLQFISSSGIENFNDVVKSCIADFNESNVFYNFTSRNKKYTLTSIGKESKTRNTIFISHDEVAEQVAQVCYDSIIRMYYKVTPDYANIISAGAWSGDLMELNSINFHLDWLISWYLKIRGTELNIQSFQWENLIYTLDQFKDSVYIHDDSNKLLEVKPHSFAKSNRVFDVIQDRASGFFYELELKNGIYSLTQVTIESNKAPKEIALTEAPLCKNIQVHDDWVYFMVRQNDFYQINRIYLK